MEGFSHMETGELPESCNMVLACVIVDNNARRNIIEK